MSQFTWISLAISIPNISAECERRMGAISTHLNHCNLMSLLTDHFLSFLKCSILSSHLSILLPAFPGNISRSNNLLKGSTLESKVETRQPGTINLCLRFIVHFVTKLQLKEVFALWLPTGFTNEDHFSHHALLRRAETAGTVLASPRGVYQSRLWTRTTRSSTASRPSPSSPPARRPSTSTNTDRQTLGYISFPASQYQMDWFPTSNSLESFESLKISFMRNVESEWEAF